jgi:nucleoid DNA-binding protein
MIPMDKKALIIRVSEKLGGITQNDAAKAIEAVFESIAEGLQEDGIVKIGKWGTYTAEDIG